jgi:hypothetical protein
MPETEPELSTAVGSPRDVPMTTPTRGPDRRWLTAQSFF